MQRPWTRVVFTLALVGVGAAATGTSAVADSPRPPWDVEAEVRGDPAVGAPATLSLTLRAWGDVRGRGVLVAPDTVHVEGDPAWAVDLRAGQAASRTWRLTAGEAGFWGVLLRADPSPSDGWGVGWCCLFVRSGADEGAWTADDPATLTPRGLRASLAVAAERVDAGHVDVTVTATPSAPWPTGVRLLLEPHVGPSSYGDANGVAVARTRLALGEGGSSAVVFEPTALAEVAFAPTGRTVFLEDVSDCRQYRVEGADGDAEPSLRDAPCGRLGRLLLGAPSAGGLGAVAALAGGLAVAAARRRRP